MSVFSSVLFVSILLAISLMLCAPCLGDMIPCDDPNMGLAPYVWKMTGSGLDAKAEAALPGAYFKTIVNGTASVGLVIDGTGNAGCPAGSMPIIDVSIDEGPFAKTQLTEQGKVYTFHLATGLDATKPHRVSVYMHATGLVPNRWKGSETHLRIVGLEVDKGGTLSAHPKRPKLAMGFGDSITEGVGVDARFPGWDDITPNNARGSWFPFVAQALDCEYGQLGSSGQGLLKPMEMPPLTETWDKYDPDTSRLTNGKLIPEPDYVFCNMGTNDYYLKDNEYATMDITEAYTTWIKSVRAACPKTHIFCVVPASGVHRETINKVVNSFRKKDKRVYMIDIASLNDVLTIKGVPTNMAYDGVHPSLHGEGMFGASIAAKAASLLRR